VGEASPIMCAISTLIGCTSLAWPGRSGPRAIASRTAELVRRDMEWNFQVPFALTPNWRRSTARKITLERRKGGAKFVSDIDLIPRDGRRRLMGRWLRKRKAPSLPPRQVA
jgi:hypothetical protein